MLTIQQGVSLKPFNTLNIDCFADFFCELSDRETLVEALAFAQKKQLKWMVLGGGSNIVFSSDYNGLVIKPNFKGVSFEELGQQVLVSVAAGENWHQLVQDCVQRGYYGLENLSLIPGSVGAAPIQNIGAYGVELAQFVEWVEGWDTALKQWRRLSPAQCEFGYRDSVFKGRLRDSFIITQLTLRLNKIAAANISYPALSDYLSQQACADPDPQQVAEAVMAIRNSKLPNPDEFANVGSFFKNPMVDARQQRRLLAEFPNLVSYAQADGRFKIAAGWLLDQAGWKNKRIGPVGMHSQQALVLVNYQNASGAEVMALAQTIQRDINARYGIDLEIEPRIY